MIEHDIAVRPGQLVAIEKRPALSRIVYRWPDVEVIQTPGGGDGAAGSQQGDRPSLVFGEWVNCVPSEIEALIVPFSNCQVAKMEDKMQVIDYHVHLTGVFTIDHAVDLAQRRNVRFGIVEHPGPNHWIRTDEDLQRYINDLGQYPVYVGLQPTYLGWSAGFSDDLIKQLDYVLMDADIVPLGDGHYLEIWRHDQFIEDMDAFVELYMSYIMQILTSEPIHIFGRPTFLPINFARHYDEVWTKERMMCIIDAARERNIALEIQENIRIPTPEFVALAKKAGIKFTFGTNARNDNAGRFKYCLDVARECGLTEDDMFTIDHKE